MLRVLRGRHPFLRILAPLLLAGVVASLLSGLHFPVAWLVGPLLAGVFYAVILGVSAPLPSRWMTIAKSVVGLIAASRFVPEDLIRVSVYLIPVLIAIGMTGGLCMFNGYLIWRFSKIDLATCLLGSIPGTATAVVAISAEFGADPGSVAILQYLRMTLVIVIVPIVASFFATDAPIVPPSMSAQNAHPFPLAWDLMLIAIAIAGGTLLGEKGKLPTGGFLGTFLVGLLLFWVFSGQLAIPGGLSLAALLVIGLSAGLKFNLNTMRKLRKAVLLEVLLVVLLIVSCLCVGYGFHWLTQIDLATALLAFAPGGLEAMVATSNQLGSDTGLVLIIMFLRQLVIITSVAGLRHRLFHKIP